jgi:hypothetical protein
MQDASDLCDIPKDSKKSPRTSAILDKIALNLIVKASLFFFNKE